MRLVTLLSTVCLSVQNCTHFVRTASGKSGYIKDMNEVVHIFNAGSKMTRIYFIKTLEHLTLLIRGITI